MSKNKSKKKKDEAPVIPTYRAENLIDSLTGKIAEEEKNINKLMESLTEQKLDFYNHAKKN